MRALISGATQRLAAAGVPSPRPDAEALLAFALGCSTSDVRRLLALADSLPDKAAERYADLVERRARRVPLQHLTGLAPFRHLELAVGPGVFIPRPETELLAGMAVAAVSPVVAPASSVAPSVGPVAPPVETTPVRPIVVDLGTGSGAIALAVATEVPRAAVYAVELDPAALAWAQRNNAAYGSPVCLVHGDATSAFPELNGRVDVVVSNPPYIPPDAIPREPEVANYDPPLALYGEGADGLAIPERFARTALRLLRPGGLLLMEHADVQAEAIRAMLAALTDAAGHPAFGSSETIKDLGNRPRIVATRKR